MNDEIRQETYPGDRKGKPLFVDKYTHLVTQDEVLSLNLIDCGW